MRFFYLKHFLLLTTIIFMVTGCYENNYDADLTTKKPAVADITGVYKLNYQTMRDSVDKETMKRAKITINTNGTFAFNNIPNLFQTMYSTEPDIISCTGKWRMGQVGTYRNLWSDTNPFWGITIDNVPDNFSVLAFLGGSPPYKLFIRCDDPSLGLVAVFSKQ